MNPPQLTCSAHGHGNNLIQFACFNESCNEFRLICLSCLQDGFHNAHTKDLKQITEVLDFQENYSNTLINQLDDLQYQINEMFDLLKNSIKFKFVFPTNILSEMNSKQINDQFSSLIRFKCDSMQLFKNLSQIKKNLIDCLNNIKQELNLRDDDQAKIKEIIRQQQKQGLPQKKRTIQKPFQYKFVNSIKENDWCRSIGFNVDSSIMAVGQRGGYIKLFDFDSGQITLKDTVRKHQDYVGCLQFMKKSNSFISGSDDNNIILWNQNIFGKWQAIQTLNEHKGAVDCLLINRNEDLIVSGSDDSSIKFWKRYNYQWSCQQTLSIHSQGIRSVSINDSQNQLISCAKLENFIKISQLQQNNQWIEVQKIEQPGFRLCYINDDQITIQPKNGKIMYIYKQSNNQFDTCKEIQVKNGDNCQCYFPQQYIQSKQILVNKNGNNINLIRLNIQGELILEQHIEYETQNLFGGITDDGEFIVTWDDKTEKLQILQFNE